MKVSACQNFVYFKNCTVSKSSQSISNNTVSANISSLRSIPYVLPKINFKGYCGDDMPIKKLYWILAGTTDSGWKDSYTYEHLFNGGNTGWKKWMFDYPQDLLKRNVADSIRSIFTLSDIRGDMKNLYHGKIQSPNYGNSWGRHANYIEINPRIIAKHDKGEVSEGLLSAIKLLPAIPPSPKSFANCVILSQLYPVMGRYDDGKVGQNQGLYTVDLHSGISKNLTSKWLTRDNQRMGDDELVKAFNDLAHLRGLKTGIRMPLSSGQITVQGRPFSWQRDEKAFIDACVYAIDLGFDAIYFDSAKHVGGYDIGNYCGCGDVPDKGKMQWINQQIREKSGRHDVSLIGEKCNDDRYFKELGFTAGTDWGRADDRESVRWETEKQRYSYEYAAGPEVSNDNDNGGYSFGTRLQRLDNCLFADGFVGDRLPTYMQMHDIFPLSPYTNTHELMIRDKFMGLGDTTSYWNDIFNTSQAAHDFQGQVHNKFLNVMYL